MQLLFYWIRIYDAVKAGKVKSFRLTSNLPFPSPIDTRLFILGGGIEGESDHYDEDYHFEAVVNGYTHSVTRGNDTELNALNMILAPLNSRDADPRDPKTFAFENSEIIWKSLIELGWEEVGSDEMYS